MVESVDGEPEVVCNYLTCTRVVGDWLVIVVSDENIIIIEIGRIFAPNLFVEHYVCHVLLRPTWLKHKNISFLVVLLIDIRLFAPHLPLKLDIWQVFLQLLRVKNEDISFLVLITITVFPELITTDLFREFYVYAWNFMLSMWLYVISMLGSTLLFALYMCLEQHLKFFSFSELFFRLIFCAQINILS